MTARLLAFASALITLGACIEAPSSPGVDPGDEPSDAMPGDRGVDDGMPSESGRGDGLEPTDAMADAMADAAGPELLPAAGALTVLAGVSTDGFVDGVGAEARFGTISCMALDGDTLYLTDNSNALVRAVDLESRAVTTLAGRTQRSAQRDGPLGEALFEAPFGCAALDGRFYVGDGYTVRALDGADARVTTLAGAPGEAGHVDGVGAEARLRWMPDLEPAPGGGLYLAERDSGWIRHLDVETGAVTSRVQVGGPTHLVAIDDRLYATTRNGAYDVIRVDPATGETERIAVPLESGFERVSNPSSLAIHAGTAWLADSASGLAAVDLATHDARFVLPPASSDDGPRDGGPERARLIGTWASPVVDAARGALYYAGRRSKAIRRIDLETLAVSTLAGPVEPIGWRDGADARFGPLVDVVHDGARWLVSDPHNHAIRAVDVGGRVSTVLGHPDRDGLVLGPLADAGLGDPAGLAHDGEHLYIADASSEGGILVVRDGRLEVFSEPVPFAVDVALGPGGRLYAVSLRAVHAIDPTGAVSLIGGPWPTRRLTRVAALPDGRVFVHDRAGAEVAELVDGELRPMWSVPACIRGDEICGLRPGGLAVAPDGTLIVADDDQLVRHRMGEEQPDVWIGGDGRRGNYPPGAVVLLADATLVGASAVALRGDMIAITAQQSLVVVRLEPAE